MKESLLRTCCFVLFARAVRPPLALAAPQFINNLNDSPLRRLLRDVRRSLTLDSSNNLTHKIKPCSLSSAYDIGLVSTDLYYRLCKRLAQHLLDPTKDIEQEVNRDVPGTLRVVAHLNNTSDVRSDHSTDRLLRRHHIANNVASPGSP